jgi:hypothetical protein
VDPLQADDVSTGELLASMPAAVRAAFPVFDWSVERLWTLQLPVHALPIETFDWLLDLPIWRWRGKRFQVSVRDVIADSDTYAPHVRKAMATDLSYPIHVTTHGNRIVILDGYHRLLKAVLLGRASLDAVEVTDEDLG